MKFSNIRYLIPLAAAAAGVFIFINIGAPAAAAEQPATARQTVETVSLDNGLAFLFEEDRAHPLAAIEIVVRTGSLYERNRQGSGLAHLVEHMLFKGTSSRSAQALHDEVRRLGGEINGYASHQFCGYSLVLPAANLRQGLELLKDMLFHPVFDEAELAKEKEVILSEIRMNRDDPERYVSRLFWQYGYAVAPYNLPVIGLEPLFAQLQRQDLVDFHSQWYMPNNMVVGICADCSCEEARAAAREVFGDVKMRPFPDSSLPALPATVSAIQFETGYDGATTYLMLGVPSVDLTDPDAPALDVVAALLGDGESSRLYQRLVKKEQRAYAVEAFNYTPRFRGMLGVSAVLDRGEVERCAAIIFEEAARLGKESLLAGELEKIKNKYLSDYERGRQTVQAKAAEIAADYAYQSDPRFTRRYMEALARVSPEDVRRCARRYVTDQKAVTRVIVSPQQPAAVAAAVDTAARAPADMRRVLLPNGVRLLLKPDPSAAVVAMHVIFGGGVRHETEETNGLFNVLSELLTRGTRSSSSLRIAQQMAHDGGTLAAFSGYNSFGVSLEILSKNFARGMALCLDSALDPALNAGELDILKRQAVKAIQMRQDDIFTFTLDRMRQTLFSRLAYRFSTLGIRQAVERLTPELLRGYHRRFCVPENMVVSICGDFDADAVEAQLRKRLSRLASGSAPGAAAVTEPPLAQRRIVEEQKDREQAVVVYGVRAAALHHPDRRVLELLNHILSDQGALLYNRIREESGLAYTLGGNAVAGLDGGYFFVYIATAPDQTGRVMALFDEELAKVRNQPLSQETVRAAQTLMISQQAIGLQTQAALGFTAGLDELYGLGYDAYRRFADEVSAITPEQLQAAARAYLMPERSVVVITKK